MNGSTTYFIQSCPTCGRRLQIRVEHMAREVSCYHCRARFLADSSPASVASPCATDLIARADQLLESFDSSNSFNQSLLTH